MPTIQQPVGVTSALVHENSLWNSAEGPDKLVDGNTSTKYGLSNNNPWVEFHYASAITPKGYALWTAADTEGGRKLDGKPTQRGIYVNNGCKIVIK